MDIPRWNKFSLPQKLGNIGSEVTRARLCEEKKDQSGRNAALKRVLEMLDATLSGNIGLSAKKELTRMREVIGCWFVGANDFEYSPRLVEEYFTQFAYLAK
jgi:hypothetical protein